MLCGYNLITSCGVDLLNKFFLLSERNTSIGQECLAGVTTFMSMAYILTIGPAILSQCGMSYTAVFAATAFVAALTTLIMGLWANLPLALAPGMGLNSVFAYTVVISMGHTWQFALTAVFLQGIFFIVLSMTRLRDILVSSLPCAVRMALPAGIGLFIAFLGLRNGGFVVQDNATLLSMGSLKDPRVLVALSGLIVTTLLLCYKRRGAFLIGICAASLVHFALDIWDTQHSALLSTRIETVFLTPNLLPSLVRFDWHNIMTLDMFIIVLTFVFVSFFDTLGTSFGVMQQTKLIDASNTVPHHQRAFLTNGIGTVLGSVCGTSSMAIYIESATGVAAGGKTGLTACIVSMCFFIALFFAPIFLLIPIHATAPVLILVGLFMLEPIKKMEFHDYLQTIPAFFTMIMMPLTYSIANGLMWGVLSYVFLAMFSGRIREIAFATYPLALLFLWKLTMM